MSTYNNFELLLFAASEDCCNKQAEDFLNVDGSGFEITEEQRKRMKSMARKYTKKERKRSPTFKWIVAACLLSLSICFTACVSIPEIREAIKNFFLEWSEDFVSIGFGETKEDNSKYEEIEMGENVGGESNSSEDTLTEPSGSSSEQTIPDPPTEILKKAYATYLPGDYTSKVELDSRLYYTVNYYENSEYIFSIMQNIITQDLYWRNSESHKIYTANINGFDAIIVENIDMDNVYSILWQDNEYEYSIMGIFSSIDEIIKVAEGIKLK